MNGRYTDLALDVGQCAASDSGKTAEWRGDLGGGKNIHNVIIQHMKCRSVLGIISFRIINCYLK